VATAQRLHGAFAAKAKKLLGGEQHLHNAGTCPIISVNISNTCVQRTYATLDVKQQRPAVLRGNSHWRWHCGLLSAKHGVGMMLAKASHNTGETACTPAMHNGKECTRVHSSCVRFSSSSSSTPASELGSCSDSAVQVLVSWRTGEACRRP
jgi:hypothetical protein